MHKVITPEPHFIPGYVGHCPRYMYRIGGTYGNLTNRCLLSPCAGHARDLILMPLEAKSQMSTPTDKELGALKFRERFVDAVYNDPILPGYDGFVPRMAAQIGKRYLAAATSGLAEHEDEMELLRCERRHLVHSGIIEDRHGLFLPQMCERMIPRTTYPLPLLPVTKRSASMVCDVSNAKSKTETYTKFTIPHFMENSDDRKFIISGYCGHIPMAKFRHGQSSKELSRSALNYFSDYRRMRRYDAWCDSEQTEVPESSSCPSNINVAVYDDENGSIPKYAGHVPGHLYKVGMRYAVSTTNPKRWLQDNRNKDYYEDCYC